MYFIKPNGQLIKKSRLAEVSNSSYNQNFNFFFFNILCREAKLHHFRFVYIQSLNKYSNKVQLKQNLILVIVSVPLFICG